MPQQVAHIVLIMKLGADAHAEALHREQVFRLRHHHPQVIQREKWRELATRTYEPFNAIVEPVVPQSGTGTDPGGGFPYLGCGPENGVDSLGRRTDRVGETHGCTADQE